MKRLLVPVSVIVGVVVETDDVDLAIREARDFVAGSQPSGHFIDGWNMIQSDTGKPPIYAVGDFDVDLVDPKTVEEAEIYDDD